MPGMFGAIGCPPPLCAALESEFRAIWPNAAVWNGAGAVLGAHAFSSQPALFPGARPFAVDGEFSLYEKAAKAAGSLFSLSDGLLALTPECRGNVAVIDPAAQDAHLAADWSGSFPLYFAQTARGFCFSSLLAPLVRALSPARDDLGVLEFLLNGYTLIGRTPFAGIRRLQPGQALLCTPSGLRVRERSRAWVGVERAAALPDVAWELLVSTVRASLPRTAPSALMMSAGWDSRTLFAAAKASVSPFSSYSHGDTASRELRLVERLSSTEGVPVRLEPIDERVYDLDALHRSFSRVENGVFPHWHRAGRILAESGAACAVAGVYGEILGGHYGPAMLLRGSRRIMAVASALAPGWSPSRAPMRRQKEQVRALLRLPSLPHQWYLNAEYEKSIRARLHAINADIDAALDRLIARGVGDPVRLVEAFISEHRGTQYINAQLLSCRSHLDVALPYADRRLLAFGSRLPLEAKVHNRLNREMLRRHAPALLRYPLAATLVPANMPILAQEASRFVRRVFEDARWRLHFRSPDRIAAPRLGWVNFEFLRGGRVLRAIMEDLKSEIWDRKAIAHAIEGMEQGRWAHSLHPMYDQMSKLYTMDLLLVPRQPSSLRAPLARSAVYSARSAAAPDTAQPGSCPAHPQA